MNNTNIRLLVGILVVLTFLLPTVNALTSFENPKDLLETKIKLNDNELEQISMRTSNAKFYPNPDGTTTAEIYIGPVHYKDDTGNWQEIDTTIRPYEDPTNDYDFACEENGLKAYFSNDYAETTQTVKTAADNDWLTWEPLGMTIVDTNGAPIFGAIVNDVGAEIEENKISFTNAFPNTIDEYVVGLNKLKHNILLTNSPEELAAYDASNDKLTLDYYGYIEYSDGLSLYIDNEELVLNGEALTTSSEIEFRDENNEGVFRIPAPVAYEQSNSFNSVECQYDLQAQYSLIKNRILFSIKTPYSWLVAPERQYPVVIDPTTDTIQPGPLDGKDSFLITGQSTSGQDQRRFNIGADPEFWITLDSSSQPIRGIIQFGFSSLPQDADITQADLEIYCHNAPTGDALTMDIYRVNKDWIEGDGTSTGAIIDSGVNWNTTDGTTRWDTPGGDHDTASSGSTSVTGVGWYTWDISQLAADWHGGTKDNYGALIIGSGGAAAIKFLRTSDHTTASERPKIKVTYISNYKPHIKTGAVENINFNEDDPTRYIDLNSIFGDQDVGDTLTFSIWTGTVWNEVQPYDSLWITAEILVNDSVEITPKSNKFGADTIQLNATDTSSEFVHHSIIVVISSVNDAPVINDTTEWKVGFSIPPPDITSGKVKGKEDVYINVTVSAYDPVERDALTYSDNTTLFDIISGTGYISFRPKNEDVGIHYVEIKVDDGYSENNIKTVDVIFEITNTNDAPVIAKFVHGITIDTVTSGQDTVELSDHVKQDKYYNFTVVAKDDDMSTPLGDILGFKVTPEEKFTVKKDKIDPTKANISFKPTNEDVGDFEAEVRVTDSINYFDKIKIIIEVKNVNDAPLIFQVKKGIYDEEIDEDTNEIVLEDENEATEHQKYTFTILAREMDPDDEIEFSTDNNKLFGLTENVDETDLDENIFAMDVTFTPTPEHGRLGYATINITVKDNLKSFDWLIVNVSVKNQNDPPIVSSTNLNAFTKDSDPDTRKTKENLTWTFEALDIVDPDGDTVDYYWDFDADDGSTDDEDAEGETVLWTFEEGREYTVTLTVVDLYGASNSTSETITVIPPDTSKRGDDSDKSAGFPFEWIIISIVIVLVIIFVVAFLFLKKRREEQEAEEEAEMEQIAAQAAASSGYGYAYAGVETAGAPGMMMPAGAAAQPDQQYGGLTPEQYAMYQQYQQMYPTLTIEQFAQYMQQYAQMQPDQFQQYQQQYMQMSMQQSPEYAQQTQPAYEMEATAEQPVMAPVEQAQPELSLPPPAATSGIGDELQAKLPPASESEPVAPKTPKLKQPKIKSSPKVKSSEDSGGDADSSEAESEGDEQGQCSNCGTPIKDGWFICPECKNPIV